MKIQQLFDVRGEVVVVTGAASGLGFAFAEALAANGARVTLMDLDRAGLDAAVDRLRAQGGEAEGVAVNVSDSRALREAIDATAGRHGRLDVAFANAGMSAGPGFIKPAGGLEAVSLEAWGRVLQTNLTSVLVTMQAAAPHMKARKKGRIIVTASIAALRAEPAVGYGYIATKAAVANLVRQAALELAPWNVLVNAVAPGPFLTNIAGGQLRNPEVAKVFEQMVPLGRIAQPDEIKGLALLLASPASSFITGTVIPIDGGATAG